VLEDDCAPARASHDEDQVLVAVNRIRQGGDRASGRTNHRSRPQGRAGLPLGVGHSQRSQRRRPRAGSAHTGKPRARRAKDADKPTAPEATQPLSGASFVLRHLILGQDTERAHSCLVGGGLGLFFTSSVCSSLSWHCCYGRRKHSPVLIESSGLGGQQEIRAATNRLWRASSPQPVLASASVLRTLGSPWGSRPQSPH
jgi:hypothetical protein